LTPPSPRSVPAASAAFCHPLPHAPGLEDTPLRAYASSPPAQELEGSSGHHFPLPTNSSFRTNVPISHTVTKPTLKRPPTTGSVPTFVEKENGVISWWKKEAV